MKLDLKLLKCGIKKTEQLMEKAENFGHGASNARASYLLSDLIIIEMKLLKLSEIISYYYIIITIIILLYLIKLSEIIRTEIIEMQD